MTETLTMDRLAELRGAVVYSADGDKIGSVEEVFLDQQTGRPEWIGLGTGFLGTKRVLVPVARADVRGDAVYVPYGKEHVKGTPDFDGEAISQETEARLYAHYGLGHSERGSETGLADTGAEAGTSEDAVDAPETPAEVIRSEEELRIGTRETEAGRLRLHKWVETEQVEVPVELRREKAIVTREPIEDAVSDQSLAEDQIEVTLREETPVVEKETVARERLRIEKEVEVDQEHVREELRKERVDIDEEDAA